MSARMQFQRRAYLGALAVALLGAFFVLVSPPSPAAAATSSQYASSWAVDNDAQWTPFPPNANPLGSTTSNCTGGSAGAWAEFTFTGFSIPAGDTIDGIVVTPKYRTASTNSTITLRDGGATLGSKPLPQNTGPSNCNGTSTLAIGGATDTWGAALTPGIINDGIQVRITMGNPNIDLDNIQLTVHHSETVVADPEADLSVTKTDGVTSAAPGDSVTYTIVAANAGPDDEPTASFADTLPGDLTCTYTSVTDGGASGNTAAGAGDLAETLSLPSGSTVTYTVDCTIDSGATGTLSNTATISGTLDDPTAGNNSATDADTVLVPSADHSVEKTVTTTPVVPGDPVLFQIVATNNGPSDDLSVDVTDEFAADLDTCSWTATFSGGATGDASGAGDIVETVSLPADATATYTATCDLFAGATGTLTNTATIDGSVDDPDSTNDSSEVAPTLAPTADLSITKTDDADTATPGDHVTYDIVVTNTGPSDEPAAVVTDDFGDDTMCTWTATLVGGGSAVNFEGVGDIDETVALDAGSTILYEVDCVVDSLSTGVLSNTATVTASVFDPDLENNSSTDTSDLDAIADLGVTVNESADPVQAGDADGLVYTVAVDNSGPSGAQDVEVELDLTLPEGVTLGTITPEDGTVTGTTWSLGTMVAANATTLQIPLEVDETAAAGTDVIEITATVSSSTPDGAADNDAATEATSIEAAPVAPTTTSGESVEAAGEGNQTLPRTGNDPLALTLAGVASLLLGAVAVRHARRDDYVGVHLR
ncbi:MAG: hypothetical protein OSA99_09550 [Acidimicrobiales bacterium]|nr:hypothetical protein [Acidimicrobiales bacterium]